MAVAPSCYYEKMRWTMRNATVSYLLNLSKWVTTIIEMLPFFLLISRVFDGEILSTFKGSMQEKQQYEKTYWLKLCLSAIGCPGCQRDFSSGAWKLTKMHINQMHISYALYLVK